MSTPAWPWLSISETAIAAGLLYLAILSAPFDLRSHKRIFIGTIGFIFSVHAMFTAECPSILLKASLLSAALQVETKIMDLIYLRRAAPVWQGKKPIPNWLYAILLVFGLRYENFDIHIPAAKTEGIRHDGFSGLYSVLIVASIIFFDGFPTTNSYTSSIVALLCLHISFSLMSVFLEDPLTQHHPLSSESLSAFWSRGWHQLFSPGLKACAYDPVVRVTKLRFMGVLAAFAMSGVWHAIQLAPPGGPEGAWRTFWFFFLNGVGCCVDAGILRTIPNPFLRKWARRIFAWTSIWYLAAWTARGWPSIRVFHKDFVDLFQLSKKEFPTYIGWYHRRHS